MSRDIKIYNIINGIYFYISTLNVMIASNNSDTEIYTHRNISPVFKWCRNVYTRLLTLKNFYA